jgi:dipeptidyl aminopeptidase/acylaminoacyl peptidase
MFGFSALVIGWAGLFNFTMSTATPDPGHVSNSAVISGRPGQEFSVGGYRAFLLRPAKADPAVKQPWVWYAPTLPGLPAAEEAWMFERFLAAGLAIAGVDVGESFGSPRGREGFSALYEELVGRRGFAPKPCLLARSRGGLMLYNWAVEHPESVAAVAGIYPVCNLTSYPGLAKAAPAYGCDEAQLADHLAQHNPVARLEPLARAGVPILHLHGDQDEIVPLEENSAALADNYRRHGGAVRLVVYPGQGHNYWPGWFQSPELVDFIIAHART